MDKDIERTIEQIKIDPLIKLFNIIGDRLDRLEDIVHELQCESNNRRLNGE